MYKTLLVLLENRFRNRIHGNHEQITMYVQKLSTLQNIAIKDRTVGSSEQTSSAPVTSCKTYLSGVWWYMERVADQCPDSTSLYSLPHMQGLVWTDQPPSITLVWYNQCNIWLPKTRVITNTINYPSSWCSRICTLFGVRPSSAQLRTTRNKAYPSVLEIISQNHIQISPLFDFAVWGTGVQCFL